MPSLFGKVQIPTGYESEQAKIALKRKLAQALLERGLSPNRGMISPLEALGGVAQAAAGQFLEKRADKLEGKLGERMLGDYQSEHDALQAAIASGAGPDEIAKTFGGARHPLIADEVKPYENAYSKRLENLEGIREVGGTYGRVGDYVGKDIGGKGLPVPPDPNKPVFVENGMMVPNQSWIYAHAATQPGALDPSQISPVNPYPGAAAAPAPGQLPPPPAGGASATSLAPSPAGGDIDLSLLNPEERKILQSEIARRKGLPPEARSLPMGNPLKPPPSGVLPNGKPYWMVNGQPYDNPEGR